MKAEARSRPPARSMFLVPLLCCIYGLLTGAGCTARAEENFDSRWRSALVHGPEAAGESRDKFLQQLPISSQPARSALSEAFLRACRVIPGLTKRGALSWPVNPAGPDLEHYPARQDTSAGEPGPLEGIEGFPEIRAYVTDLTAIALLARYHVRKSSAARSLALFEQLGDVSMLRSAGAHARAAADLWEQLSALILQTPGVLFGSGAAAYIFRDLQVSRGDLALVTAVDQAFHRYGLFDAALSLGAEPSQARDPLVARWPQGRFRKLTPVMSYNRERGFGWLSLQPGRPPTTSGLRGIGNAVLAIDLPDGAYRIVALVANQPELASGAFQIRSGPEAVAFEAGETGEKSLSARVAGGRLDLRFVPGPANDWLVNALLITRLAPHIGWIPPSVMGLEFSVAATLTAPDGIAEATLSCVTPEHRNLSVPLVPDGAEYRTALRLSQRWMGKQVHCRLTAVDRRGTSARLPSSGDFSILVR